MEGIKLKDIFTLIGLLTTIIIGICNLSLLKGNRYISNVSAERMKWINNTRDLFSQYNKLAVLQITRFNQLLFKNDKNSISEDMSNEILYLNNHIELFLNPNEITTEVLLKIQSSITKQLFNDSPNDDFNGKGIAAELLQLHYVQQVILKTEWKRYKVENKAGKEIDKNEMSKLFKDTAMAVNEENYNKLFKEHYNNQLLREFG
jgi:hypothetical protein